MKLVTEREYNTDFQKQVKGTRRKEEPEKERSRTRSKGQSKGT